jgi:hypothetical protein
MKESREQEDLEAVVALTDSAHHQNATVSARVDGHTHRDGHLRDADLRVAIDAGRDNGTEEWQRVAAELVVQTRVEAVHHCVEIGLRVEVTE